MKRIFIIAFTLLINSIYCSDLIQLGQLGTESNQKLVEKQKIRLNLNTPKGYESLGYSFDNFKKKYEDTNKSVQKKILHPSILYHIAKKNKKKNIHNLDYIILDKEQKLFSSDQILNDKTFSKIIKGKNLKVKYLLEEDDQMGDQAGDIINTESNQLDKNDITIHIEKAEGKLTDKYMNDKSKLFKEQIMIRGLLLKNKYKKDYVNWVFNYMNGQKSNIKTDTSYFHGFMVKKENDRLQHYMALNDIDYSAQSKIKAKNYKKIWTAVPSSFFSKDPINVQMENILRVISCDDKSKLNEITPLKGKKNKQMILHSFGESDHYNVFLEFGKEDKTPKEVSYNILNDYITKDVNMIIGNKKGRQSIDYELAKTTKTNWKKMLCWGGLLGTAVVATATGLGIYYGSSSSKSKEESKEEDVDYWDEYKVDIISKLKEIEEDSVSLNNIEGGDSSIITANFNDDYEEAETIASNINSSIDAILPNRRVLKNTLNKLSDIIDSVYDRSARLYNYYGDIYPGFIADNDLNAVEKNDCASDDEKCYYNRINKSLSSAGKNMNTSRNYLNSKIVSNLKTLSNQLVQDSMLVRNNCNYYTDNCSSIVAFTGCEDIKECLTFIEEVVKKINKSLTNSINALNNNSDEIEATYISDNASSEDAFVRITNIKYHLMDSCAKAGVFSNGLGGSSSVCNIENCDSVLCHLLSINNSRLGINSSSEDTENDLYQNLLSLLQEVEVSITAGHSSLSNIISVENSRRILSSCSSIENCLSSLEGKLPTMSEKIANLINKINGSNNQEVPNYISNDSNQLYITRIANIALQFKDILSKYPSLCDLIGGTCQLLPISSIDPSACSGILCYIDENNSGYINNLNALSIFSNEMVKLQSDFTSLLSNLNTLSNQLSQDNTLIKNNCNYYTGDCSSTVNFTSCGNIEGCLTFLEDALKKINKSLTNSINAFNEDTNESEADDINDNTSSESIFTRIINIKPHLEDSCTKSNTFCSNLGGTPATCPVKDCNNLICHISHMINSRTVINSNSNNTENKLHENLLTLLEEVESSVNSGHLALTNIGQAPDTVGSAAMRILVPAAEPVCTSIENCITSLEEKLPAMSTKIVNLLNELNGNNDQETHNYITNDGNQLYITRIANISLQFKDILDKYPSLCDLIGGTCQSQVTSDLEPSNCDNMRCYIDENNEGYINNANALLIFSDEIVQLQSDFSNLLSNLESSWNNIRLNHASIIAVYNALGNNDAVGSFDDCTDMSDCTNKLEYLLPENNKNITNTINFHNRNTDQTADNDIDSSEGAYIVKYSNILTQIENNIGKSIVFYQNWLNDGDHMTFTNYIDTCVNIICYINRLLENSSKVKNNIDANLNTIIAWRTLYGALYDAAGDLQTSYNALTANNYPSIYYTSTVEDRSCAAVQDSNGCALGTTTYPALISSTQDTLSQGLTTNDEISSFAYDIYNLNYRIISLCAVLAGNNTISTHYTSSPNNQYGTEIQTFCATSQTGSYEIDDFNIVKAFSTEGENLLSTISWDEEGALYPIQLAIYNLFKYISEDICLNILLPREAGVFYDIAQRYFTHDYSICSKENTSIINSIENNMGTVSSISDAASKLNDFIGDIKNKCNAYVGNCATDSDCYYPGLCYEDQLSASSHNDVSDRIQAFMSDNATQNFVMADGSTFYNSYLGAIYNAICTENNLAFDNLTNLVPCWFYGSLQAYAVYKSLSELQTNYNTLVSGGNYPVVYNSASTITTEDGSCLGLANDDGCMIEPSVFYPALISNIQDNLIQGLTTNSNITDFAYDSYDLRYRMISLCTILAGDDAIATHYSLSPNNAYSTTIKEFCSTDTNSGRIDEFEAVEPFSNESDNLLSNIQWNEDGDLYSIQKAIYNLFQYISKDICINILLNREAGIFLDPSKVYFTDIDGLCSKDSKSVIYSIENNMGRIDDVDDAATKFDDFIDDMKSKCDSYAGDYYPGVCYEDGLVDGIDDAAGMQSFMDNATNENFVRQDGSFHNTYLAAIYNAICNKDYSSFDSSSNLLPCWFYGYRDNYNSYISSAYNSLLDLEDAYEALGSAGYPAIYYDNTMENTSCVAAIQNEDGCAISSNTYSLAMSDIKDKLVVGLTENTLITNPEIYNFAYNAYDLRYRVISSCIALAGDPAISTHYSLSPNNQYNTKIQAFCATISDSGKIDDFTVTQSFSSNSNTLLSFGLSWDTSNSLNNIRFTVYGLFEYISENICMDLLLPREALVFYDPAKRYFTHYNSACSKHPSSIISSINNNMGAINGISDAATKLDTFLSDLKNKCASYTGDCSLGDCYYPGLCYEDQLSSSSPNDVTDGVLAFMDNATDQSFIKEDGTFYNTYIGLIYDAICDADEDSFNSATNVLPCWFNGSPQAYNVYTSLENLQTAYDTLVSGGGQPFVSSSDRLRACYSINKQATCISENKSYLQLILDLKNRLDQWPLANNEVFAYKYYEYDIKYRINILCSVLIGESGSVTYYTSSLNSAYAPEIHTFCSTKLDSDEIDDFTIMQTFSSESNKLLSDITWSTTDLYSIKYAIYNLFKYISDDVCLGILLAQESVNYFDSNSQYFTGLYSVCAKSAFGVPYAFIASNLHTLSALPGDVSDRLDDFLSRLKNSCDNYVGDCADDECYYPGVCYADQLTTADTNAGMQAFMDNGTNQSFVSGSAFYNSYLGAIHSAICAADSSATFTNLPNC